MNFAVSRPRPSRPSVSRTLLSLAGALCLLTVPLAAQVDSYPGQMTVPPMQFPNTQTLNPAPDSTTQTTRNNQNSTNSTSDTLAQSSRQQQTQAQTDQLNQRNRPTVPDVPSEFQRLVSTSIGKDLPIFGASLFRDVPSTFAPVDNIPVSADYVVGPGDELRIQVYGQVDRRGSYTVDRSGDIAFPEVGTIHVAGVRYAQLQSFLTGQFRRVYRNFELNVNLGQLRSMQVFVVGAARRPGAYTISALSTLLNALFVSGGPLPQGSLRDIQVQRAGHDVTHFDLYDLLLHGNKTSDIMLQPEDVIFIPPVGPQVAVYGSVDNPAIYEIRAGETVSQALALAGGKTSLALDDEVQVTRIYEHSMRNVIEVNLKQSDPVLANGDILVVRAIIDRYKNAVTLRGNVSFPGRYMWHPGMTIRDLVPTRDQLITPEYYRRRNALGAPAANELPLRNGAQYGNGYPSNPANCNPAGPNNNGGFGSNGTIYGNNDGTNYGSNDGANGSGNGAVNQAYDPSANQANCNPNYPGGGYPNGAYPNGVYPGGAYPAANGSQQAPYPNAGMTPSGTSNNAPFPSRQSNGGSQGGNSVGTALTQNNGTFRAKNKLVLSAPDVDWSYAVIERLNAQTLKTTLIPFNPGLLYKEKDQSQNLELQAGDVVTFFSTADINVPTREQTRLVRLEGEFTSSGIYSVLPGETLRQLVTRAGGLTPDAYLYGSEFTRESTQRVQQQRLQEYADTLETQVSAYSASSTSGAISAQDAAATQVAASEARQSIERLRRTVPEGRIVLEVKPDSRGVDSLPDIPLEDGDRFIVPRVPSTVAVEGSVYSANAFIFQRGRKAREYVREAGGPDRYSDPKHAFVLRADGSVFSSQYGKVAKATIFPGDTIVIPPQIDRRNVLRTILDISTIAGQLGIAIAAIKLLGL